MRKGFRFLIVSLAAVILLLVGFGMGILVTRHVILDSEEEYYTKLEDSHGIVYYHGQDGSVYKTFEGNQLWVWSLADYNYDTYVVPKEIDGYPITGFAENAYVGNTTIQTLILTYNIEFYDVSLYYEFSSLRSLYIGEHVDNIMGFAFTLCPNLQQVTVDARNNTYYSENNCILLKKNNALLFVSAGMTAIPPSAKSISGGFTALPITHLVIPDHIAEIQAHTFQACETLRAVYIPESVQIVGKELFLSYEPQPSTKLIVFCEAQEKPSGWDDNWDDARDIMVHWGATVEDYRSYLDSLGLTSEAND